MPSAGLSSRIPAGFDAMLATLKILEMLALSDLTMHQAIRHVPQREMVRHQVPARGSGRGPDADVDRGHQA